ncbi:hypothetical protein [Enterobacter phage 04_vB_Eclo_IJM]|nr:hypothetical protein [Enterobacter phage 04_vB_Eclo_IJM]
MRLTFLRVLQMAYHHDNHALGLRKLLEAVMMRSMVLRSSSYLPCQDTTIEMWSSSITPQSSPSTMFGQLREQCVFFSTQRMSRKGGTCRPEQFVTPFVEPTIL